MKKDSSPQLLKGMNAKVKQAMCHLPIGRLFRASLLCLLTMAAPAAKAQTAGIEQAFSGSLTVMPATDVRGGTGANFVVDWAATGEIAEPVVEALFGGIGSGHYAFVSQDRPIKIIGKN
jgi:hypothetical protein